MRSFGLSVLSMGVGSLLIGTLGRLILTGKGLAPGPELAEDEKQLEVARRATGLWYMRVFVLFGSVCILFGIVTTVVT